jgi:hypothetical protein
MTRADHDESYRIEVHQLIVATALEPVDGGISVTEASRQLARAARDLGVALEKPFIAFVGIDSEADAFPLAEVREMWNPAALRNEDDRRATYEARVRDGALAACREIIRSYSTNQ